MKRYDLFIIGGGINGAGIARDAAGRGLSVGLCEKDDLAQHTSSASTKLIHGGLRYLEQYDFSLVRKSLRERELLLHMAPHIIWPLRFVLPHHSGLRPAWVLRIGLCLYDLLDPRSSLPRSRKVRLDRGVLAGQLRPEYSTGFCYSDCWVEDARLVVLNAMDARERGADILTHTRCTALDRHDDHWRITLQPHGSKPYRVESRLLVNAAGPWVGEVAQSIGKRRQASPGRPSPVRLVKGSHIVVRKLFEGEHAYLFQNTDERVIFAIPFEQDYTLIGTTEVAVASPEDGGISADEEQYLCRLVSEYFTQSIGKEDIVWHYSGIRPLYDDRTASASEVTRDYVLELDDDAAPALSIFGGKLTTYRKLAEEVLERLRPHTPEAGPDWTAASPLPGGDFQPRDFDRHVQDLARRYRFLEQSDARRLFRAYGTRVERIFSGPNARDAPGESFANGLYEAELEYLVENEFVQTAEDVLWRRSKLGLHLSEEQQQRVREWFGQQ